MIDAIEGILKQIQDYLQDISANTGLTKSFETYNKDLFNYVDILKDVVMTPIAMVILSLFLVLELQKIATRVESTGGNGQLGFELVMKTLVKMALCKFGIDSLSLILKAITAATQEIIMKMQDVTLNMKDVKVSLDIAAIVDAISNEGFFYQMFGFLLLLVSALAIIIAKTFAQVMMSMRYIELYVLYAVAPIPIATIPNEEWSSVAKNFFKTFTAVCFQGVLLFIVLQFFPIIINQTFSSYVDKQSSIFAIAGGLLGNAMILSFSVMATGRWAKSITNAM